MHYKYSDIHIERRYIRSDAWPVFQLLTQNYLNEQLHRIQLFWELHDRCTCGVTVGRYLLGTSFLIVYRVGKMTIAL